MWRFLPILIVGCAPITLEPDRDAALSEPDAQLVIDATPPHRGCIQVTQRVDFGSVRRHQRVRQIVRIRGCRWRDVTVESVSLDGAQFSLAGFEPLSFEAPRAPTDLVAQAELGVIFEPQLAGRSYVGVLRITTNDPIQPSIEIPLHGQGSWAGVRCDPWVAQIADPERSHVPGDVLDLVAVPPAGVEPAGTKVRWSVARYPPASTSFPVEAFTDPDDPAEGGSIDDVWTPQARFLIDEPGSYTFVAHAQFPLEAGCSESESTVRVNACPCPGDLQIQLRWRIEGQEPPPGVRSDLSLHLLHPAADRWGHEELDCWAGNGTPDWGILGLRADDPVLDGDDVDAPGIENILLDQLEDGLVGPWRIAVEMAQSDKWTAQVDLQIRARGVVVFSAVDRRMDDAAAFWDVAGIAQLDEQIKVVPYDRMFPGGQPPPPPDQPLSIDSPCLVDLGPSCGLGLSCVPGLNFPVGMCDLP